MNAEEILNNNHLDKETDKKVQESFNKEQFETKNKRHYGLDLLRIVSMIMIIFLHINSHGGFNNFWEVKTPNGLLLTFLFSMSMVSVNAYVLLSGYFLIEGTFKPSKIIKLALETFFYSIVVFTFLTIKSYHFSLQDYLKVFLPITYNSYWFVTAYIGMYLLSPAINKLINVLKTKAFFVLLVFLIIVYCILRDTFPYSEPFEVSQGYSLVWFIIVYMIGAFIKKTSLVEKFKHPFSLFLIFVTITFLIWVILSLLAKKFAFIEENKLINYYFRYNSFPILFGAIFLFITFARIKIKNKFFSKIILFVSPLVLGVYLIHDNAFFRDYVWFSIFRTDTIPNDVWLVPKAIGIIVTIFIVCICLEFIRALIERLIFKVKPIRTLMFKIDSFSKNLLTKKEETQAKSEIK